MEWILFDKDSTLIKFDRSWEKTGVRLVDSFPEIFPVANREATLRKLGIVKDTANPDSAMGSGSLGGTVYTFNDRSGKDVSKWTRDTSQTLVNSREPESNWIDGVYDMIQSLRQKGYKIGIVTSDSEKGVTQFLGETHSKDAFNLVISTETHATERPNPEVLKPLFDHYDAKPEDVAIVGDANNDMKTKVNAKLSLAISVLSGIAKKEELMDVDYVIGTAVGIPEVLKKYTQNN